MHLLKHIAAIDQALKAKKLGWRTLFIAFLLMAALSLATIFLDGGLSALVLMALYLVFAFRYIVPNIQLRGPFF